jgi:hypothetical protein
VTAIDGATTAPDLSKATATGGFGVETLRTALENLGRTGQGTFQGIGGSVINDLIPALGQAQEAAAGLSSLFTDLFGSVLGKKGVGGFFSKVLGAVAGSVVSSQFGGFREAGGPVTAGKAYVVGEKRPEIFIPGMNGSIAPRMPNAADMGRGIAGLGGAGGSGRQTINVTVNAKDAVLTNQVRNWVAEGVQQATLQGAQYGSDLALKRMSDARRRAL